MPDVFVSDQEEVEEEKPSAPEKADQPPAPLPEHPPRPSLQSSPESNPANQPHHISLMNVRAGKPGFFTAFAPRPEGITFQDQENQEDILLFARRHFITNVPWIAAGIALLFLPLLFLPLLPGELVEVLRENFSPAYLIILLIFYYLIVLGYLLYQFTTWFYQVGIITTLRIIDVDFNTLLARNIAYTDITDIVDTDADQKGILQGIFNFGNVGVQTAGMKANFEFTSIPYPNKVVDLLSDLMRDRRHHE